MVFFAFVLGSLKRLAECTFMCTHTHSVLLLCHWVTNHPKFSGLKKALIIVNDFLWWLAQLGNSLAPCDEGWGSGLLVTWLVEKVQNGSSTGLASWCLVSVEISAGSVNQYALVLPFVSFLKHGSCVLRRSVSKDKSHAQDLASLQLHLSWKYPIGHGGSHKIHTNSVAGQVISTSWCEEQHDLMEGKDC